MIRALLKKLFHRCGFVAVCMLVVAATASAQCRSSSNGQCQKCQANAGLSVNAVSPLQLAQATSAASSAASAAPAVQIAPAAVQAFVPAPQQVPLSIAVPQQTFQTVQVPVAAPVSALASVGTVGVVGVQAVGGCGGCRGGLLSRLGGRHVSRSRSASVSVSR